MATYLALRFFVRCDPARKVGPKDHPEDSAVCTSCGGLHRACDAQTVWIRSAAYHREQGESEESVRFGGKRNEGSART